MNALSLWKGDIECEPDPRPPGGMKAILAEVLLAHGVTEAEIRSGSRLRRISYARHAFMWRCRQVRWPNGGYRYSMPLVAGFLGLRNHTSVVHGASRHAERLATLEAA